VDPGATGKVLPNEFIDRRLDFIGQELMAAQKNCSLANVEAIWSFWKRPVMESQVGGSQMSIAIRH
jgi:hypothetical protein